jgi:hypothetical protein
MPVAVQGGIVPFDELAGQSPNISFNRDSRSATRVGKVAGANLAALYTECFPSGSSLPGAFPGIAYMYVDSLDIKPFVPEGEAFPTCGDLITYDWYLASIKYGKLDYESSNFLSRKWSYSGEFMTLPANAVKWKSDKGAVENEEISAAMTIPQIEHSLTRNRATSIPWSVIQDNIGKVNDATLNNSIFTNVAAQTLLYMGAQIDWTFSTDGTQIWNIEHRFIERIVSAFDPQAKAVATYGWNHFYRPDKKLWDILIDDTESPVYTHSEDFMDLFT